MSFRSSKKGKFITEVILIQKGLTAHCKKKIKRMFYSWNAIGQLKENADF